MHHRFRRISIVALTALAVLVAPLAGTASATSGKPPTTVAELEFVETTVGAPVSPVAAGDTAPLLGVTLTAPTDRSTYVTDEAMIAVLQPGQDTATFGLDNITEDLPEATVSGTVQADGSVLLAAAAPEVRLEAMIAPPWAKDANGASLPTWYEVDSTGTRLTQHVNTAGAAYPIAADPRLTFGWGVYFNITGAEIKGLVSAVIVAGGAAAITTCAIGKYSKTVAKVVALLCGAVGAPTVRSIINTLVSLWRNTSIRDGACYQRRIVGPSTGWYTVAMRNCTG